MEHLADLTFVFLIAIFCIVPGIAARRLRADIVGMISLQLHSESTGRSFSLVSGGLVFMVAGDLSDEASVKLQTGATGKLACVVAA